jgi:outer membrane protein TolC
MNNSNNHPSRGVRATDASNLTCSDTPLFLVHEDSAGMTRNALTALLLCGSLIAQAAPVAAQTAPAAPNSKPGETRISEQYLQQLIQAAAQRAGVANPSLGTLSVAQGTGGPGQATAPQGQNGSTAGGQNAGPTVDLSLDDAVKLALDRNLDIAVQRLNPATYDYSYATLAANYKPSLVSTIARGDVTTPNTSRISGATGAGVGVFQGTTTFNGGVSQNVKWGGGSFIATLNNSRQLSSSLNVLFNPVFNTNWSAQYTQPLLRNFKTDTNRQQLVVTKLNQDISEIQLQSTIINTVSNVRNAYWDLVFAVQSVDVAQQSVTLADRLVQDNQTRVEIGTMAPIDVVQAQSQAALQRQNLAAAVGTQRTSEIALKRLIVAGAQDTNWNSTINPTDRPDFVPQPIDVAGAVRRGLENRTDLQTAKKNLSVNDVTLTYLRNQVLPQTDLVARYGYLGAGGSELTDCVGAGVNQVCNGNIPGGYSDALSSLLHGQYPSWSVQLNVSYPLGFSSAEATVARARVQQSQVEAQVRQIELQIATDITNAAVNIQSNVERVQAAVAAREFAQKTLEAEQSKFEVGMSTNYFVVQDQRDLATAQNNELQAILAYRKSLVELERLQQTSLTTSNITLVGH